MADKTSSSMLIGAPRAVLMAVIADFAAYPEWAAGVSEARVLADGPDGRAERVRFSLDAGLIKDSYTLAYSWLGDNEVSWELAEKGTMVTQMSGAYRLKEADDGTEVSYELAAGTAIPMFGPVKRKAEKTIIDTALKGLRDRAARVASGGDGG